VLTRKGDDASTLALQRLNLVLERWKQECKAVQLARRGLPGDYDEPFEIHDPRAMEKLLSGAADMTTSLMLRIFPFMLVMWSLAGALYPAVDVCAGEKERGTMETLLITPAAREEIVLGKFLTIWVFSAATALLNLASMGITTWLYSDQLPAGGVSAGALVWCVVLLLPLSAMFSAICLAIGAYARSSKEGQYYLMPLFLVTMPLIFLTLAPGVELNSFYSMVPVTGVAMLMQSLMTAESLAQVPWPYFLPVLAPVILYTWLALRWGIDLFQREEVLFREAERLDVRLWLRRLFREKEMMPTPGQALFCFGLLLGLHWLWLGLGGQTPPVVRAAVVLVAFVAAPPTFMALTLTHSPRYALSLHYPRPGYVLVALLLLPAADLALRLLAEFPGALAALREGRPSLVSGTLQGGWPDLAFLIGLAALSAVCLEVAFRGWILNGLRQRFRPRTAVVICSILYAAFHLNVFAAGPQFALGLVLGYLAVRSNSLLPGTLLHVGCEILLAVGPSAPGQGILPPLAVAAAALAAAGFLLTRLDEPGGGWRRLFSLGSGPRGA
jgi:sodium transport system permease protein